MRLLLDTHSFLWFIMGSSNLSTNARALIEDVNNEKFVSKVSLWEIAIKISIGKLTLSGSFDAVIPFQIKNNGFETLEIELTHLSLISSLSLHHRDPFDRLIITQSILEDMAIIGKDPAFDLYSVKRLW